MRAPCVVRWPGHIKPGTVYKEMFASLDWVPTFVDIAGGPKGDELKKQIEGRASTKASSRPRSMALTSATTSKASRSTSARDVFFYYTGSQPSAVRYKNWKFYYTMVPDTATGGVHGSPHLSLDPDREHHARPLRDRRRQRMTRRRWATAARLPARATAYIYDWNILPIGQLLWLKELQSYVEFPPMQDPASYNLDQVLEQVKREQVLTTPSE